MKNNSRKVVSNQLKRNTKLLYRLKKNYQNDFIPIISKSTLKVYEQIKNYYKQEVPIILDNGCGTGQVLYGLRSKTQIPPSLELITPINSLVHIHTKTLYLHKLR